LSSLWPRMGGREFFRSLMSFMESMAGRTKATRMWAMI
jgi:hypothetical protein